MKTRPQVDSLSKEDVNILKRYHQLDPIGKSTISFLLDREVSRVKFSRLAAERINELEEMVIPDVEIEYIRCFDAERSITWH